MFDVLRRYREMRPASVLVIFAALIFCGYNVHRALGFGSHTEQASLGAEKLPSSSGSSLDQFEDLVLTNADLSTLKSVEKLTRIEDLQVGERIRSDAPTEEFDLQFGTDIIRADWRKLTLVAPKRDGSSAEVVLLRPLQWLNEQQAEVGGTVYISVPECGIDGHADVLAIDPCPPIEPAGNLGGRVITGTFRHQVSASISLSIAGQAEPVLCTGNHPFWSEDRQDFVRADSLQPKETLRTTTGTTTVTSLRYVPGATPVYNLEIHGTHVYHVGTSGVLVHNSLPCDDYLKLAGTGETLKLKGVDWDHIVKSHVDETFDAASRTGKDVSTVFKGTAAEYRRLLETALGQKGVSNAINEARKKGITTNIPIDVVVNGQSMRLWVNMQELTIETFHAFGKLGKKFGTR